MEYSVQNFLYLRLESCLLGTNSNINDFQNHLEADKGTCMDLNRPVKIVSFEKFCEQIATQNLDYTTVKCHPLFQDSTETKKKHMNEPC